MQVLERARQLTAINEEFQAKEAMLARQVVQLMLKIGQSVRYTHI